MHGWWSALFALCVCAPSAVAQSLTVSFSEQVRGGLAVDAWGELGTSTTFASGAFTLRLPRDARVRRASLHSAVLTRAAGTTFPAGPTGSPRQVIVGTGATQTTVTLEGAARYAARSGPYLFGSFVTDVTESVRALVGTASSGELLSVPVRERGDDGPNIDAPLSSTHTEVTGHTLVVEYELDFGPLRNVVVYEGCVITGRTSMAVPLPGPVANRCPPTSTRGEPFAASITIPSEYDLCQEDNTVTLNGRVLSAVAGGADDWPTGPSIGCDGRSAGLITAGSFGGSEPQPGFAAGAPIGIKGDSIGGLPAAPRRDDELYDFRPFLADGDTTATFGFSGTGDENLDVVALQTLARLDGTDADRDGVADTTEGDCTADTDNDGTPDYLDTDSDNDCLADSNAAESGAARTSPTLPRSPDANCPAERPTCDLPTGTCVALRRVFFEDWESGTSRWVLNAGPAGPLQVLQDVASGCTHYQRENQPTGGGRYRAAVAVPVDPARSYCLTAWVRGSAGTQPFLGAYPTDVGATTFSAHDWLIGVSFSSAWRTSGAVLPVTADGTWRWYAAAFRVPAGTRYLGVMNELFASGAAGNADFDDIALYEGGCPSAPPATGPSMCPTGRAMCSTDARCVQCTADTQCTAGSATVCDVAAGSCVECVSDATCRALTPVCATMGMNAGRCVQCTRDAQCGDATPVCDTAAGRCRACTAGDCTGATPACATAGANAGRCVACVDGSQCSGATPICDAARNACRACAIATQDTDCPTMAAPSCSMMGANAGRCVACTSSTQCPMARPVCGLDNTCAPCTADLQCPMDRPACATSGAAAGTCVRCNTDAQCGASLRCDAAAHACVGCLADADCSGATPLCDRATGTCRACDPASTTDCTGDLPACATSGASAGRCVACTAASRGRCTGATAVCDPATNMCVGCAGRDDCMGATPVCDATTHACRGCSATTAATDCPSTDASVCATSGSNTGRCVQCATAAHCAGATPVCGADGRCAACTMNAQCPTERPVCAAGDGCVVCATDADCGTGRRCERGASVAMNQCVAATMDAGAPDVVTADAGNTVDVVMPVDVARDSGPADAGMDVAMDVGVDAGTATGTDDGGCGCSTVGARGRLGGAPWAMLAVMASALGAARRKRTARA